MQFKILIDPVKNLFEYGKIGVGVSLAIGGIASEVRGTSVPLEEVLQKLQRIRSDQIEDILTTAYQGMQGSPTAGIGVALTVWGSYNLLRYLRQEFPRHYYSR